MKKPVVLIILDGFGHAEDSPYNAITNALTPCLDELCKDSILLSASGDAVGLPDNLQGNSEVGHMTIGAGKLYPQDLLRINECIKNGKYEAMIKNIFENRASEQAVHLLGIASKGGVHGHIEHLRKSMNVLGEKNVYLHMVADGRDVFPKSILEDIKGFHEISTLTGRFYAMDRDGNLDRTQVAIDGIVHASGRTLSLSEIEKQYADGVSDEFLPSLVSPKYIGMKKSDIVIMHNFRADRTTQIARQIKELGMEVYGFADYFVDGMSALFPKEAIKNTLGERISRLGIKQLRIAESEKYPHVTFFFNGLREVQYKGEERIKIESNKLKSHELLPEMKAKEITKILLDSIASKKYGFILVNYANADMVGHSGDFNATLKAVETLDKMLKKLLDSGLEMELCITADHGNAESMYDPEAKEVVKSHTSNKVPFIYRGNVLDIRDYKLESLKDIADFIMQLLEKC